MLSSANTLPVFLINMARSSDRLTSMSARLRGLGLTFERVDAVDGHLLDLSDIKTYDSKRVVETIGRSLSAGEVGCYLSHLRALEAFVASGSPHGLVLEDDAMITAPALDIAQATLAYLVRSGRNFSILHLGIGIRNTLNLPLRRIVAAGKTATLEQAHLFPPHAFALIWSREGALGFLAEQQQISRPVDEAYSDWVTQRNDGFIFREPLVKTAAVPSEIDSTGEERRLSGPQRQIFNAKMKEIIRARFATAARFSRRQRFAPKRLLSALFGQN